jgi:hypothetical protein
MNANREKTSSMTGLVVSVLLHGIFFAGCYALDAADTSSAVDQISTEINTSADPAPASKSNS